VQGVSVCLLLFGLTKMDVALFCFLVVKFCTLVNIYGGKGSKVGLCKDFVKKG
jgi:hypothetical protein